MGDGRSDNKRAAKKGKDPTCKQGTRQKLVGTACRAVCICSQRDRSRQMMMLPNYVFCMCDTVEKAEKAPRSGPGQAPCMTNAGRLAGRRSLARAPSLLRRLCQGCLGVCQCVCVCSLQSERQTRRQSERQTRQCDFWTPPPPTTVLLPRHHQIPRFKHIP